MQVISISGLFQHPCKNPGDISGGTSYSWIVREIWWFSLKIWDVWSPYLSAQLRGTKETIQGACLYLHQTYILTSSVIWICSLFVAYQDLSILLLHPVLEWYYFSSPLVSTRGCSPGRRFPPIPEGKLHICLDRDAERKKKKNFEQTSKWHQS